MAIASTPPGADSVAEHLKLNSGRIVVLNFWASWCQPCVREIPLLQRISAEYSERGVIVLGASVDEPGDRKKAARLFERLGARYPTFFSDLEGMKGLRLATSLPATAMFDRDGRRVFRLVGELSEDVLRSRIDWLMGDRVATAPPELVLPAGITPEHFAVHESGEDEEHDHADERASAGEGGSAVPG